MKIKLPLIGEISVGRDQEPLVQSVAVPKKQKGIDLLGGALDFGKNNLSTDKKVSDKLIESFYEWVFINVTTLAEEVSKMEFELYKVVLEGGQYKTVEIENHPLLDLLDKFNSTTTRSDGIYTTEAHLELTGDSFWYLVDGDNGRQPSEIKILRPDEVELKFTDTEVSGYRWKTTVNGKPYGYDYSTDEILPFRVPNPKNPYRGFSPVEGIANTLDIDTNAITTNRSFYENGMIAQFMLTTDKTITQDQLKRLRTEMKAAYGGSKNFYKIPIFGGGIEPKELQMSSRDAQLIAQQEWLRDKIMAAFKNTKASLGITEDVNRANAEATLLSWKQSTIKPKMQRMVDALNEYLVPRYGDNLILGFCDPVPEDVSRKIDEATKLFEAGIINQNEARDYVGYDTTANGENFSGQSYATSEQELPKSIQNVNYKSVFRKNGVYEQKQTWLKAYEEAKPLAKKLMTKKTPEPVIEPKEHAQFTNDQVWDFHNKQIHIVEVAEAQFQNKCEQYINDIVKMGVAAVDNPDKRKTGQLLDKELLQTEAIAKFGPILTEVVIASGNHGNRLIGSDNPYIPKAIKSIDMREQIRQQIELFASSMVDTDEQIMVDIIASGLQEGASIAKIRKEITDKFSTYTKSQAEKVTRTEVIRASNAGLEDAFNQSGVVEGKQWLTAMDDRVDPECEELNGKILDLGGIYEKSDYLDVEYPPIHPNCRCTILPVLANQKKFDSKEYLYIKELEQSIDKRTKEYRKLKNSNTKQAEYIEQLEKLAGIGDE